MNNSLKTSFRRKSSGFTLIEMLVALGVAAFFILVATLWVKSYYDAARAATFAQEMKQVASAASAYVRANFVTVRGTPGGTPGVTMKITSNNLSFLPYVSGGVLHKFDIIFYKSYDDNTKVPPVVRIQPIVVNTDTRFTDEELVNYIAAAATMAGGVFRDSTIFGSPIYGNGINVNTLMPLLGSYPYGTAFMLAGVVDDYDYDSGALYRNAIAGRPELNRMNTDLDMDNHDINNVKDLRVLDKIYANSDIQGGGGIYAEKNIASNNGIYAQKDIVSYNGKLYAKDGVLKDVLFNGKNVALSSGVYYSNILPNGGTVSIPNCPSGMTQQVFAAPVQILALDNNGRAAVIYGINAQVVSSQLRVQTLIRYDGSGNLIWTTPGMGYPGQAYGLVYSKCS